MSDKTDGDYSSYRNGAYRGYLKQVKCTHKMLDNFLKKLNSNPATKDSKIIIQGDHGSRITSYLPLVEFADQISKEEYIQFFSTFFAVRGPNHTPGYDRRPMALDKLTRSVISTKNSLFETGESKFVYLPYRGQRVFKKYSLPPFAHGQPTAEW